MGRVLFLEPMGGIAGDMFLAAALDLGVDRAALDKALSGLALDAHRFEVTRAERHSITGTHLDVIVTKEQPHHRALSDIEQLIRAADTLSDAVKALALKVFRIIGEAEAHIHGVPLEAIHFHEVGAVDSIVDICGAAVVLELLGFPDVYATPPPMGSGQVRTAHGLMPVPAPATLEILRDVPVRFEGVGELTTPTGAALLKAFARIGPPPELRVERVGYGVGTRKMADRPNVLRASIGQTVARMHTETAWVLEANLDDCSPQTLSYLLERVLADGALDAYVSALTMKKGRPGHLFGVIVPDERRQVVTERILRESTTLGVRAHAVERSILERRFATVTTSFGDVRVKLGLLAGDVVNVQPEYEDCRVLAERHGVPLKRIQAEAAAAYAASPK